MYKTTRDYINNDMITVDTDGLMQLLSCGRNAATQIGLAAGAKIKVGKRVLWFLPKIQHYLSNNNNVK